jgi:methionine synthase II (cobalamin-independent)
MEQRTGKIKQDRVMTAVVGSYPKPKYLYHGTGRELLDELGMTFGIPKIGLPGPSTVVDSVADAYYLGNRKAIWQLPRGS